MSARVTPRESEQTGTAAPRPVPSLTPETTPFFTGGRDGELLIYRCGDCGYWSHPPVPRCPACLSAAVGPRRASGRATVASFTVNWHPWHPAFPPPYVIAIVELDEQPGLRLTTNLVDCPPGDVSVGMPVTVGFQQAGETWLPVFAPAPGPRGGEE